jgi:NAD+ synthase (glutamine-hydrolysing)
MVFCGHNLIAEYGSIIKQSDLFSTGITFTDIDLGRLSSERRRVNTFPKRHEEINVVEFELPIKDLSLKRDFPQNPFVPSIKSSLKERCEEIIALQYTGLASRLRHIKAKNVVLGLSGGLDSTLALIVTVHAFDNLNLDRKGIYAVTMPCFGTTSRTKNNAEELAKVYGVTFKEIPISKAVLQHFEDIGHDNETHDVTYENSQARERTQVLMDMANKLNGIVIGTGDLSELALGWATYNGDHMSMYGVNASVPKTLVKHLVDYEASKSEGILKNVLIDILDTPVSPELLPPKDGEISQKTENLVGPYELHDFFLYYFLRFGYPPRKIYRIACLSFKDKYSKEIIKNWFHAFIKRFFSQQFKRSCLPDGPKVGSVTLSPRGDFRMPSDASAEIWLNEIDELI